MLSSPFTSPLLFVSTAGGTEAALEVCSDFDFDWRAARNGHLVTPDPMVELLGPLGWAA